MNRAANINIYNFSDQDNLFFDTNIWLYLYGPQGNPGDPTTQAYSQALARAVSVKSRIFLDVLVASEFINRFARMEYDIQYSQVMPRPSFKQFRNQPVFLPIAQAIVGALRNILKFTIRLESGFSTLDINKLLNEFETIPSDFNDQILVSLCKSKGLKLVTHDGDFKGKDIDILTANNWILH